MVHEPCGCLSCDTGPVNDDDHRRQAIVRRNGQIAAELSEQVRLGLMDPAEAAERVRKLGR